MSRRISANGRYLAERVCAYIERTESGCWEWQGTIEPTGYGRISIKGRLHYVHRVVYELLVEPVERAPP